MSGGRNTRAYSKEWQHLYRSEQWARVRARILVRDDYRCSYCGRPTTVGMGPHTPVVHHKQDHKGDLALFWDENNLTTVGKSCHDRFAQKEAHGRKVSKIGEDGWPE